MSTHAWNAALDAIEADLVATEAALVAGESRPDRPAAPVPAEPLPAELGPRAQALLARTVGLEARAAGDMQRIRKSLGALSGRRPSAIRTPTGRVVDIDA